MKLISNDQIEDINLKDKLFFHDVINHTHGLILFLSQKEIQKEVIDQVEIKLIKDEIKILQGLIKDHYSFNHKNLLLTEDWVVFGDLESAFINMTQTYLNDKKIKINILYDKSFDHKKNETLFYFPTFYRIMNNLVKNIAESKSKNVEFNFTISDNTLEIKTSNEIHSVNERDIPDHLAMLILKDEESSHISHVGLGLESIHHLTLECGGSFNFEIKDNVWTNSIILPSSKNKNAKIAA
jgi:hypothetical protein